MNPLQRNLRTTLIRAGGFIENRGVAFFFMLTGAYFSAILVGTNFLRCLPWSDEWHFIETVRMFVGSFSLATIKSYVEIQTPLAYMMFALAGICFGDHVWVYRLFTMACALTSFSVLFVIMRRLLGRDLFALAAILFFIMSPYVIGLSVFVYNDMPGVMFLAIAVLAAMHRRYWLFCLASASAILCRQYNAFIPAAVAAWAILVPRALSKKEKTLFLVSALLSLLPAIALFLFWGDIAPPKGIMYWNLGRAEGFHPDYIVIYVTLFAVYAAPAIIIARRCLFTRVRVLLACTMSGVYFIYPIRPSPIAVEQVNISTIGFLHKFVKFCSFGDAFIEQTFFYILFVVGLLVLVWLVSITISSVRKGIPKNDLFLLLGVLTCTFLAVMSFSFLVWEKYLVPIMPFLLGWILMAFQQDKHLHQNANAADVVGRK